MCGIAGFISDISVEQKKIILKKMGDSLVHRGPDAEGFFINNKVGFVHRRLSIIDLDTRSNQPFISSCGQYVLIYNGEIFNFKELKTDLLAKGYRFRTTSDTEVLLNFLIEYGLSELNKLNGFFAFAFYSLSANKVYLVRDRTGVKPLFYTFSKDSFFFASEPKAFFEAGVIKELDDSNFQEVLFYRFASGPNTIFKNIYRVLPAHYVEFDIDKFTFKSIKYFFVKNQFYTPQHNKPLKWFEETFNKSVMYRLIADVKIGLMLSGGLDSSSVLYSLYSRGVRDIYTFTIAFPGYKNDESDLAARISSEYGFKNIRVLLDENEIVTYLKKAMFYMDEPPVHYQEAHLLKLSEVAKNYVTVLLSGEGSDELLGGYVRYKIHYYRLYYFLSYFLKFIPDSKIRSERLRKLKRYASLRNEPAQLLMNANTLFLKDLEDIELFGINVLPEYRINILSEAEKFFPDNKFRQLLYIDQHTYLPSLNDRNDRTTMGASIECREPFQDINLISGVASLPDKWFSAKGKGKYLLMHSIGKKLPHYIQNHRKIGLSIPWQQYIRQTPEFKEHLLNMHTNPICTDTILYHLNVKQLVQEFLQGSNEKNYLVVNLFMLSYWYKEAFRK